MIVVSIDIGYHHLGIVETFLDEGHNIFVNRIALVDLQRLPHKKIKRCECCIPHTNEVADLMAHFIQEYGEWLDEADQILVERQPPTGLTQIETLLVFLYRKKINLVSPNSMHKHFAIGAYEYERRKEMTIKIADPYLINSELYQSLERKHDIADALCMVIFHTHPERNRKRIAALDRTLPFDNYKYESPIRKTSRYFEHR